MQKSFGFQRLNEWTVALFFSSLATEWEGHCFRPGTLGSRAKAAKPASPRFYPARTKTPSPKAFAQ